MSGMWGNKIKVSIFGESHGNAIGINIDGWKPFCCSQRMVFLRSPPFQESHSDEYFPHTYISNAPQREEDERTFFFALGRTVIRGIPALSPTVFLEGARRERSLASKERFPPEMIPFFLI